MNSTVRIVKRGTQVPKELETDQHEKSGPESTRLIVKTVKSWIAEAQQRKLAETCRSSALKH